VQGHAVSQCAVADVAAAAGVARLVQQAPARGRLDRANVLSFPDVIRTLVGVDRLGYYVGVLLVAVAFAGA
jgi:hypothetical protein